MGNAEERTLMRRFVVIALLGVFPAPAAAQTLSSVSQESVPSANVRFEFPPPEVRIGEFRAALRVRLHFDWRDFNPELGEDEFLFRRARVALEGRLFDDLEYELDADLRDEERPWRDVYLNYRRFRAAEIQGGRFKIPFGLEQTTGIFNINFVERSLIGSDLSPARERGGMVHGRVAKDILEYQVGVFAGDGDSTRFAGEAVDQTWAGRVVLTPWENNRGVLHSAQIGANATWGSLDEGLFGMRGRTLSGYVFFEPVYVKGQRRRLGVDGRWTPGSVLVQAEYIRVTDERNGQGLGDVDLPDAIAEGWYLAGTWVLTGENKSGGSVQPSRPFPTEGVGAIELAARIEELKFSSAGTGGEPPFANPRAANILPNRDRILTLGVNWYLNRFVRIVANGTREDLLDPMRTPELGRTRFWGAVLRLQFVM
jgi:phosphate-selective porin OprO and OprP